MSSARRSMSAQSAEAKRKTAGKLSKLAMAAVAEVGDQQSAASRAAPFPLPALTKHAFAAIAAEGAAVTDTDKLLAGLVNAIVEASDLASQFTTLHALAAQVARVSVSDLSYGVRSALHRGLLDLLTLKLQMSVRTPILRALDLLDGPAEGAAPEGEEGASLLERGLSSVFTRMLRAPTIALVVLFDQALSWKATAPFFAERITAILPATTAALHEIVVSRFKAFSLDDQAQDAEGIVAEDEEDSSASSSSSMWMSPSDQTRFLLRTQVTYLLRFRKELQALFNRLQAAAESDSEAAKTQHDHLRALTQMVGRIMQHSHVHRDVLTQCGLILTVLLQLSCGAEDNVALGSESLDQLTAQAIFHIFFAQPESAIPAEPLRRVPVLVWLHSIDTATVGSSRSFDGKLQLLSRLAFVRSVATHSSLSVLLRSGLEAAASDPQESLLLAHLFPLILASCKAINPHIRAYSLQSVEVLLLKCKTHIQACGLTADAVVHSFERPLAAILELLYSNWDHPFKAIPGIVKGIFMHLIEVRNLLLKRELQNAALDEAAFKQQREEYWSRFIAQILHREPSADGGSSAAAVGSGGLTTSSRGVFTMLLVLMPQISVGALLRVNAGLIASLFVAGQFRPMWGITNQLIEVILERARDETLVASRYVHDATATAAAAASGEDGEGQRSKQKRKKDVLKQRLKAKAAEAGVATAEIDASAAVATTGLVSAPVYTEEYLSQLASWRGLWTPHIVSALYSPQAMWRSDVASCTLTHLFKVLDTHEDALDAVLRAIQAVAPPVHASEEERRDFKLRQMRALVTVLKTARRLGMVTSRDLDTRIRNDEDAAAAAAAEANARLLPISSSQLQSALLHSDLDLRLEVFEFICNNLASTELISQLELRLLRTALPYLLKISVPNVRSKFVHAVQRFMLRVRDSVNREIREEVLVRERAHAPPNGEDDRAAFAAHPHLFAITSLLVYRRILPSLRFFEWLECFLFDSLYPSAPFERTCGVLELYRILLDGFVPEAASASCSSALAPGFNSKLQHANNIGELVHWRVRERVFTAGKTRVLVNLLASNWERVRNVAFELLERYPTPLPGFDEPASLRPLLKWAVALCRSARMRDAEGGALALRLLVKKYVVDLRWQIDYEALARGEEAASGVPSVAASSHEAILFFFRSLHRFLRFQLEVIASSPLATRYADPHSRVHGTLLLFRLVLSDVPWGYWDQAHGLVAAWQTFATDMLAALKEVAEISLSLHIPTNAAAALRSEQASTSANMDCRGHPILAPGSTDLALAGDDFTDQAGEQIVVVSSWLAVKEVALSLGGWLSAAPLPTSSKPHGGLFTLDQLRTVGSLFFAVLSCSKHNGVLENAHQGFLAVCATLLEAGDALQTALVDQWLASLMQLIANPWENDTWIRRSRGIAYCLLAILQAEPTGQKQPAHDGEATTSLSLSPSEAAASGSLLGRCMHELMRMARVDTDALVDGAKPRADLWKLKVHGLNILRAIFRDSLLAVDALPYVAPALAISIEGFAHPNWNVRNSSLITFGALLSKAVRAQIRSNVSAAAGAAEPEDVATGSAALSMVGSKSGMTAKDFFNHFPTLHAFLLDQLRIATAGTGKPLSADTEVAALQALDGSVSAQASPVDWGSDMHPSLYPILLLLSRLVPSHTEDVAAASLSTSSGVLDMHAFLPFIRQCSFHPYYMARWMAAKAVVSLVPGGEVGSFVLGLVAELPTSSASVHHNHAHGTLMQAHTLLRFHHYEAQLLTADEKAQVATSVLEKLLAPERKWLASSSMRCALVRLLFLQTVEICVEYLEASAPAPLARKRLLVLAAAACDAPPANAPFEGVATDTLRSEAAVMVVRSICCVEAGGLAGGDLTGLVIALSRGARSLALEESLLWSLRRCLTLQPVRMGAHLDLQAVHHHLLHDKLLAHTADFPSTHKSNYTIQELSFQMLVAFEEQRIAAGPAALAQGPHAYQLAAHWSEILAFTVNSIDVSVKCAAFTCLSVCLSGEFDGLVSRGGEQALLSTFLSHAATWLELLQAYMDDEQPVALRYACVKAIQSSGMLRGIAQQCKLALADSSELQVVRVLPPPAFSSTSPLAVVALATQHRSVRAVCITLWSACIVHLLQDENETVRVDISTLVGDVVEATEAEAAAQAVNAAPSLHTGQTLVSRVLEQSFAYMFRMYADEALLVTYLDQLIRFYSLHFESVFDNAASTKSLQASAEATSAGAVSASGSAPFKLFEHEKANTVIEEVIVMELAAHYLEQAHQRRLTKEPLASCAAIVAALGQWSDSFLACLASFAAGSSASSADGWVGGASFLEAAFVRVYGQVLGLASVVRVAARLPDREPQVQMAIDRLRAADLAAHASGMHPLLQRALLALDQRLQTVDSSAPVGFLTHVAQSAQ